MSLEENPGISLVKKQTRTKNSEVLRPDIVYQIKRQIWVPCFQAVGQWGPIDSPKYFRLFLFLLLTIWNFMVRSYC